MVTSLLLLLPPPRPPCLCDTGWRRTRALRRPAAALSSHPNVKLHIGFFLLFQKRHERVGGGGSKGAGQADRGGGGGGGVGVCFRGASQSKCAHASMREKVLLEARGGDGKGGGGGAPGHSSMALKLLFWELEKHLKR